MQSKYGLLDALCRSNPDKRDKCLHQIFFLLKNKKKISKALKGIEKIAQQICLEHHSLLRISRIFCANFLILKGF